MLDLKIKVLFFTTNGSEGLNSGFDILDRNNKNIKSYYVSFDNFTFGTLEYLFKKSRIVLKFGNFITVRVYGAWSVIHLNIFWLAAILLSKITNSIKLGEHQTRLILN